MHKTEQFLQLYEQYFSPLKERKIRLLEIGVQFGGSIAYWRETYPRWDVWGLDIDKEQITMCDLKNIVIGSQKDTDLLATLPAFDVIIDDGGHQMSEQQETFAFLFPRLNAEGIYIIEDTHTSYWPQFLDDKPTTDFIGALINDAHPDSLKARRAESYDYPRTRFEIKELHIYPSVSFICKN